MYYMPFCIRTSSHLFSPIHRDEVHQQPHTHTRETLPSEAKIDTHNRNLRYVSCGKTSCTYRSSADVHTEDSSRMKSRRDFSWDGVNLSSLSSIP